MKEKPVIIDPVQDQSWQQEAECLKYNTSIFYPIDEIDAEIPKKICKTCIVQAYCLEYALEKGEPEGVWGGTSERERERILRNRTQRSSRKTS